MENVRNNQLVDLYFIYEMAKLLKHFGLGTPKKCNYEATSAELKESDVNLKQSVTNVDLACNEVPGSSAVSKVGKTSKSRNNSSASVDSSASVNINRTESLRSVVQTRKISRAEEAEMLAYSRSPTPAGSSPDIRGTKKHQEFHKKAIRKHKVKIPVTVPNKHLGITSDKVRKINFLILIVFGSDNFPFQFNVFLMANY